MHTVTITFKSGAQQTFKVDDWKTTKNAVVGVQELIWTPSAKGPNPHYINLAEVICIAVQAGET